MSSSAKQTAAKHGITLRKVGLSTRLKKQSILHWMILPSLLAVIAVNYFPLYGILISFKHYSVFDGVAGSPWARSNGFEHFIDFFTAEASAIVVRNTVVIAFLKLGLLSMPPVILAIMLNELRSLSFKKWVQTITYLPHFVSWIIVGGIIYNFLNAYSGPVNIILIKLGLVDRGISFLSEDVYFWPVIVLSHLWKEVGWESIIYLAVIATIDPNLYEAAEIDGAGRWKKITNITWPYLKGTFMILFILHCGRIMSGYGDTFDQVYVLGNVVNRNVSDILDTYILRVGLVQLRFSFATAIGLFRSLSNLLLLVTANYLSKKLTDKSLF